MRTYRWRDSLPGRVSVRGTLPGDSSRNSALLLPSSSRGCGLMKHVTVFPTVTIVLKTLRRRWDSKAQLRFGGRFNADWESTPTITASPWLLTENLCAASHTTARRYKASPELPEWLSKRVYRYELAA